MTDAEGKGSILPRLLRNALSARFSCCGLSVPTAFMDKNNSPKVSLGNVEAADRQIGGRRRRGDRRESGYSNAYEFEAGALAA